MDMAVPNYENRTLFESDNLPILLGMDSDTVDLVATDPPFKKDKKFQGIGEAEGQTMDDTWRWHGAPPGTKGGEKESDIHKEWLDHTREHWPALNEIIEAAYHAHTPNMAAFLAFMSVRLIEINRILKPTGSLYLHCDPTANSYLRLMLDSIFGVDNFRNEIVWSYRSGGAGKRWFARKHDTILFYVKTDNYDFHVPTERSYNRDFKPYRFKNVKEYQDEEGRWYTLPSMRDVWEIPMVGRTSKERVGWTTQKPLKLYRRIVEASSNDGDIVLDPFCGCATTCIAAEQLGRQWVGIDQSPKAKTIVKERLAEEVKLSLAWDDYVTVSTVAPKRTDVKGLFPPTFSLPPTPKGKRRGRRRTSAPSYDRNEMRVRLAIRDGHYCQGCGMLPPTMPGSLSPELDYLDIDHIVPRADAGSDHEKNLCLLCPPCNRRKANIWTLAQLRQANQRMKKMLDKSKLRKELEKV
ncbi:MAG: DNA methyltransferase [Chloroflexota bacterium]|nr:DNA methyltransferase [Chloroflexota bacterium]MDE2946624.1 DNA methyltransferase [Chloroflexota bacterium]